MVTLDLAYDQERCRQWTRIMETHAVVKVEGMDAFKIVELIVVKIDLRTGQYPEEGWKRMIVTFEELRRVNSPGSSR